MLQKLEELHRLCFPYKPWSAQDFADLKESGCDILASDNGFVVWRMVLDEAEVITIGVRPDARGGGIAAAMLTLVETDLIKHHVQRIFLEVAENNNAAISLYKKYGYEPIAVRPKYYDGIDAILMEKKL